MNRITCFFVLVLIVGLRGQGGESSELYQKGFWHQYGKDDTPVDAKLAFQFYNKSASLGNSQAQAALGFLYALGEGVERDEAMAMVYWMFASLEGEVDAEMALGYRHAWGVGTPQNCEPAANFYRKVADSVISDIHSSGIDAPPMLEKLTDDVIVNENGEPEERVQYFKYTAQNGNPEAQHMMGQVHWQGAYGMERDYDMARRYFEMAVNQGHADAAANLGHMYAQGLGVLKNETRAVELYKKVENESASAKNGLGYMYLHGLGGCDKNITRALVYFRDAAHLNNGDAQLNYGALHLHGQGVRVDYEKALQYFTMSARAGRTTAAYYMGIMHNSGLGTIRSCSHAVTLFKSVAEKGGSASLMEEAHELYKEGETARALMQYRVLAEQGIEVAQSNAAWIIDKTYVKQGDQKSVWAQRALRLFLMSAAQNNIQSRLKVGDYYYYGTGTPVSHEQAIAHYSAAADVGNSQALWNLGYMHEFGLGLPQDFHLAKRNFDASLENSPDAAAPVYIALAQLAIHYLATTYPPRYLGVQWDSFLIALLFATLVVLVNVRLRLR